MACTIRFLDDILVVQNVQHFFEQIIFTILPHVIMQSSLCSKNNFKLN